MNVLSLDGGGAKGVYSLGVLNELEQHLGEPLHEYFDLIYGTSTGAIIASLLALGHPVQAIEDLYFDLIPAVMANKRRKTRSEALVRRAREVFGTATFADFKTHVGIVAVGYDAQKPMVFKSHVGLSHGLKASFKPGFGCTVADAVVASSAAFPFFEKWQVRTENQGDPVLLDGGFAANNPTLLSIADAHGAMGFPLEDLRVLSVGVGQYKEPNRTIFHRVLFWMWPFELIQRMFVTNTNTIEGLRRVLFPEVACIRVDEAYPDQQYATDLLEADPTKLRKLYVLGRDSYGKWEKELNEVFPRREGP